MKQLHTNLTSLLCLFVFAIGLHSCKKETDIPLPPTETPVEKPFLPHTPSSFQPKPIISFGSYPMNYLQIGNYWIYESGSSFNYGTIMNEPPSVWTYDSVVVTGFKMSLQGDSLFKVDHYTISGSKYQTEYLRITPTGDLLNEAGQTLHSFLPLHKNFDYSGDRKGCGAWEWSAEQWWGRDGRYETESGTLITGSYGKSAHTEWCPDFTWAWEGYQLAKGIGIVTYSESEFIPNQISQNYTNRLIRFKLKH